MFTLRDHLNGRDGGVKPWNQCASALSCAGTRQDVVDLLNFAFTRHKSVYTLSYFADHPLPDHASVALALRVKCFSNSDSVNMDGHNISVPPMGGKLNARTHEEYQYLDLIQSILQTGEHRPDRSVGVMGSFSSITY